MSVWEGMLHEGVKLIKRSWINYNSGTKKYRTLHMYMACENQRHGDFYEDVRLLAAVTAEIDSDSR